MHPLIDIQLVNEPVSAGTISPFPKSCGAECIFLGRTREDAHPEHGDLTLLAYEAYEPLARAVLRQLADEVIRRYGCRAVRVHHALGEVPVGAASVLVQIAAGHREQAFDACRLVIDRLKEEAPIWKREIWADGTTWSQGIEVEQNTTSPQESE